LRGFVSFFMLEARRKTMPEQIYYYRHPWLITDRRLQVRGTMYVLQRIFAVRLRIKHQPGMFFLWLLGVLLLPSAFATTVYWLAFVAAALMIIGASHGLRQPVLEIQLADGRWQALPKASYAQLHEVKQKLEDALLQRAPVAATDAAMPSLLKR
jgi:hypothetical protein